MNVTKRDLIVAGGLALAAPVAIVAIGAEVAIYDSRIEASRAFAADSERAGARLFDIAHEEESHWRGVRSGFGGAVIGLTRWSDWTILRGAMEARGGRVRREVRIDLSPDAPRVKSTLDLLTRDGPTFFVHGAHAATLFAWRMSC